jgi:protein-export membrane protein SecD
MKYLKATINLILLLLSLIIFINNIIDKPINNIIPKVNFGIDISGGNQILLQIDKKDYIKNLYNKILSALILKNKEIEIINQNEFFIKKNEENYCNEILNIDNLISCKQNKNRIFIEYKNSTLDYLLKESIQQIISVLQKRIDSVGTKEIKFSKYNNDSILVLIPHGYDFEKIKSLLTKQANLSFKLLAKDLKNANYYKHPQIEKPIPLEKFSSLTGEEIIDARTINDGFKFSVFFKLNEYGKRLFAKITKENKGMPLFIVLDDVILTSPIIQEEINQGSGVINGNFNLDDANNLSVMLKSGSINTRINIESEENITSSMKNQIIKNGKFALLISLIIISLVMIYFYKILGLVSIIALIFNFILTIDLISIFGFALTLSGFAGLILMLGMAIDANVLIYEKMLDLLSNEKIKNVNKNILLQGYNHAQRTILDANLTTILAALSLFIFGTEFLKSFAIVLILGILVSLFTSIVITKALLLKIIKYKKLYL